MVLPKESILFRMGGDEFLVLLPNTTEETALDFVRQMKENEKIFHIQNKQLSVSFGVSVMESKVDVSGEKEETGIIFPL